MARNSSRRRVTLEGYQAGNGLQANPSATCQRKADLMMSFANQTIAFFGGLDAFSRVLAARAVIARGGAVVRGSPRRATLCVFGHRVVRDLGRLQDSLRAADAAGARVLSENQFLRELGLMAAPRPDQRTLRFSDIVARSGIAPAHLRLLLLLDIIEPGAREGLAMRDLLLARSVAKLLHEGSTIAELLRDLAAHRRSLDRLPPNLFGDETGHLAIRIGKAISEVGGQLRLPLPAAQVCSMDELIEAAAAADDARDWAQSERLYRRCVDRDRNNALAAFNLGNALCRLGREREGRLWLQHAVGIDSAFADAWYNLGVLAKQAGNLSEACRLLERAMAAESAHADAMFNLAALRFDTGDYAAAEKLWRRYLEYDSHSLWAGRARSGLALCRQLTASKPLASGSMRPTESTSQPA